MQALKSLYVFSMTKTGNLRRAAGTFLPAQLVLGTGDKIKIFIRVNDIAHFAKNNIEVIIPTRLDAEKIMRQMQTNEDVTVFNQFIKEKKIRFEI